METQDTVIDSETGLTIAEPKFAEVMVREDQTPHVVPAEALPDFDEMDEGFSLAAKYREFETAGEKVRALFVGFTTMQNQQGKVIPVAMFQNKEGVFVNAGANLVSQVRQLPAGTAVQVTYQGKEKTKTGNNVKVFDVRLLNARQVLQAEPPKSEPTPTEPPVPIPPEVAAFNPGPGVQIKGKKNGDDTPKRANVMTPKWKTIYNTAVERGWIPKNDSGFRMLVVAKQAGFDVITEENIAHVAAEIARHYEDKEKLAAVDVSVS